MTHSRLARLGAAIYASLVLLVGVPAVTGAQTSGANAPVGVQTGGQQVQLPRTGNPEADTGPNVPLMIVGGGALLGILVLRRRWLYRVVQRKEQ